MKKLGEKIKEIRLKEGLSQEAFAKKMGYNSRSTINKIEKGINEISYEKLMLLIKSYEIELDELFDKPRNETFVSSNKDSILFISFSLHSPSEEDRPERWRLHHCHHAGSLYR